MGKVGKSYSYNVICDECGLEYKSNQLMKRWDGLMVCEYCWEPRHPQDFLRVRNDTHKLPYVRPEVDKRRVAVSISGDITHVQNAWTLLGFNEELTDQYNEFNTGTSTFQPSVNGIYTFRFSFLLESTGGNSSLEIALYKNGTPFKVVPPVYTSGAGQAKVGASFQDQAALSTDLYTIRYRITTLNGVIKALDNNTVFEVA